MNSSAKSVKGPSTHQPTKAELEEDVCVDATPEALAWAVTRGGADRRIAPVVNSAKTVSKEQETLMPDRQASETTKHFPSPNEMLNELVNLGYIVPAYDDYSQPIMPSAYQTVPNVTSSDSAPVPQKGDGS